MLNKRLALRGRVRRVAYSVVEVDELEGAGPGGAVRFVRRALGVEAFGINWFQMMSFWLQPIGTRFGASISNASPS